MNETDEIKIGYPTEDKNASSLFPELANTRILVLPQNGALPDLKTQLFTIDELNHIINKETSARMNAIEDEIHRVSTKRIK